MAKDETSGSAGVGYLMAAGVPGKKILLGIPLFGRSFLHATGTGQKYKGVGGVDGTFEYKDLPRRGTKEQVDKRSVAAQCVGGDGGFVTYDNPDTVKVKAAFCKQKGLGVSLMVNTTEIRSQGGNVNLWDLHFLISPLEDPSTAFYPLLLDQHHVMQAQKTKGMWKLTPSSGTILLVRTGRCQRQQTELDCSWIQIIA